MIKTIILWSINNRFLVVLGTLLLVGGGLFALKNTPIDAIPDLSDVQVIIKTTYPGQAPQVVEDQVTYPLTTAMLSVPGRRRCAVTPFLATLIFTSFLMTIRICTGLAAGCSNTLARWRRPCRPRRSHNSAPMRRA